MALDLKENYSLEEMDRQSLDASVDLHRRSSARRADDHRRRIGRAGAQSPGPRSDRLRRWPVVRQYRLRTRRAGRGGGESDGRSRLLSSVQLVFRTSRSSGSPTGCWHYSESARARRIYRRSSSAPPAPTPTTPNFKFVRYYNNLRGKPEKKKIISRLGSYHGLTAAAGSLTGILSFHKAFDLPLPGVMHTSCPHFFRFGEAGEDEDAFTRRMVGDLKDLIHREGPETVAAFIAEPIMGTGGAFCPAARLFRAGPGSPRRERHIVRRRRRGHYRVRPYRAVVRHRALRAGSRTS